MKLLSKYASVLILSASFSAFAQEETQSQTDADLYNLSLEELMNVPINSASKKDETLFDAPLSSYTITRAEIDRAGSTSIMEALRLAPGVIVREQTNGTYDIHIRGFDNILRTSGDYLKSNLITLVMIDNRPVFNNNIGGTFWESLPIDLNDVERIEIVRGPSAPLFGPNAVSGVINIITKRASASKMLVNANVQGGSTGTLLANASVGKSFGKWSAMGSVNTQQRQRYDSKFFQNSTGNFVDGEDLDSEFNEVFPNPNKAMSKWGVNGFIGYKASEKTSFDLSIGTQQSEVHKVFIGGNDTKFSTNESNSYYANLSAKIAGLSIRTSYLSGMDNLSVGNKPGQYDFQVSNMDVEYAAKLGKNVTLTPGVSYQGVTFNDEEYQAEPGNPTAGLLNGEYSINSIAGFLRSDINLTSKWRLLAGLRVDKFSAPDDAYLAYEAATTYKLNDKNLIRAAVTRSNSGSFIGYNYINVIVPTPVPGITVNQMGNTNLKLFTINMIEIGYRAKLSKAFQLDIDFFTQTAENFTAIKAVEFNSTINAVTKYQFNNVPTTAVQNGATIGLNFVPSEKIQVKAFATVQKTTTKDLPSSFADASLDPSLTYSNSTHKSTPSVFGGYYLNYKPSAKFNFNINGYYWSSHRQYDAADPSETSSVGDVAAKFIVNAKATWHVTPAFNVFVNGRNATANNSREFFGTDRIKGLYMVGASFSLR